MSFGTHARRWSARGATALIPLASAGVLLATAGTQAAATTAQASMVPAAPAANPPVTNPYAPAYHHPYRHGAVPTRGAAAQMAAWARQHPGAAGASRAAAAPSPNNLSYGGGVGGIGVTTGRAKVYLVFFGSQWGRKGRNSHGYVTLSGDHAGEAPYLQRMFKGLGTNGERWSGVMTQYCQGIAAGRQSCPASSTQHVAYPSGGVLAGVWVDESAASPAQATAFQLGTEAVSAAAHFGNTTAAANRDTQYDIISPTGTHPDGFNTPSGAFCAWHDWNGDPFVGVTSPYGDIAFTNMPYVTDLGASCGENFVNAGSAGLQDGISIVNGHEYAETITDQNPAGGWTDSTGAEDADKCAWITPGTSGGSLDLTLATGTFAMQTTWANDGAGGAGACEASHPIVANGAATTAAP